MQLEVLNQLEQLTSKKISELFDYMVGSGIGGLFLLAMVYGKLSNYSIVLILVLQDASRCKLSFGVMIGHVYVLSLLADPTADKSVRQLQRLYYQYMQRVLSLPDAKKSWRELENFSHDLFRSTRMDDNVFPK